MESGYQTGKTQTELIRTSQQPEEVPHLVNEGDAEIWLTLTIYN